MKLLGILAIGLVAVAFVLLVLWRLEDHDADRRNHERFEIDVAGAMISGTIWRPDGPAQAAVALVHGDGPQDRTSAGGYAPIINALLDRGIAVAAWDKPGVGASDGNWLDQSMEDRAEETRLVLHYLREQVDGLPLGALGFSQAGWVLPVLTRDDADFAVFVGAAVNWQDQGDYYTRVRLAAEGMTAQEIEQTRAAQISDDARLFGPEAKDAPEDMSRDRWRFIQKNRTADARAALDRFDLPLLALWGANDLNVDAARNAEIFRDLLDGRSAPTQITIWPNATHSLLKAQAYNWQLAEDWSSMAVLRFLAEGRYAYAPEVLDTIADWILAR